MSLNQRYTWADFLKEYPEHKEKKTKRTSPDGKKAFEAAFKKQSKEYLKTRLSHIETLTKRATEKRNALVASQKELVKKKKQPHVKLAQQKIGRQDAWIVRLGKQAERTKTLQKSF